MIHLKHSFPSREETEAARRARNHTRQMIFAGLIAAKEWQVNPSTVEVSFVPLEAGREIIVRGKTPIKDNYLTVEYPEDIVTLQEWRREDEISVFLAYSKICNVLVVRI